MSKSALKRQSAPTVKLPAALSRRGASLIDQQMWCWGCDVRRAEGNLLLAYGCQQRPSPEPRYHSAYTYTLCRDCALTLWGWGIWIAAQDHGSLFVSRGGFRVRWIPQTALAPMAWQERDLPRGSTDIRSTDALLLLREAVLWIAVYERWVAGTVEQNYRVSTVSAWPQRRRFDGGVSTENVADQWEKIAETLTHINAL